MGRYLHGKPEAGASETPQGAEMNGYHGRWRRPAPGRDLERSHRLPRACFRPPHPLLGVISCRSLPMS
jgi:hypothetical protein